MRELRDNTSASVPLGPNMKGHEAVGEIVKGIRARLAHSSAGPMTAEQVADAYGIRVLKRPEMGVAPYFRVLYTILKRVSDNTALSVEKQIEYGNLLRSQMTNDQLLLAACNGLSPVSKDFGELITEFHLLKYLADDKFGIAIRTFYPPEASAPRGD